jgi:serine carboxypeptidase-like clade 1
MFFLQTASIIFIDYPVGTGYSYATRSEGYHMTDTGSAKLVHQFLRTVSETVGIMVFFFSLMYLKKFFKPNKKKTMAMSVFQILKQWLIDHPEFTKIPFFVASDTYAGIITPIVAKEIFDGNFFSNTLCPIFLLLQEGSDIFERN